MMTIEKCDITIKNPLFGSGLPYKPKVRNVLCVFFRLLMLVSDTDVSSSAVSEGCLRDRAMLIPSPPPQCVQQEPRILIL